MTIQPDTKDWTWVLRQPCPECGFDTQSIPREQVGRLLRDAGARYADLLATDPAVRDRPRPDKWSPLEYTCHVRDVLHIFGGRLELMITTDGPLFPNWDQDETALAGRYIDQSPPAVSKEIIVEAESLADAFDAVADEQWGRTGSRSDGVQFTVESLARYLVHDTLHHWYDIQAG
jgi:DinB family protein